MAKLHFGTENGAESERSANNSRVGMQSKAFSAGSVSIQIDRQKERERERRQGKEATYLARGARAGVAVAGAAVAGAGRHGDGSWFKTEVLKVVIK